MKGITQAQMGSLLDERFKNYNSDKEINKKSQSFVSTKFRTDNWTVDSVVDFLDNMGYELVIKPKSRGKRSENEIVVEHRKKVQE
jgi:hypothetical protein